MSDPNTDDRLDHEDLTEAERAELEAGDHEAQQAAADAEAARTAAQQQAGTDDDDDDQDDDRAVLIATAKAATDAANAATEALRRQQQPPQPDPEQQPAARDFAAEEAALRQKYEDGEIDRDEFYDARLTLERERSESLVETRVAERLQQRDQQTVQQQWEGAYAAFLQDQANARLTGRALNAAFNTAIQEIFQQDPSITHDALLAKARDQVYNEIGVPVPSAQETREKIDKAVKGRRADEPPPMDTGRIPQAGSITPNAQDAQLDDLPADQLEDWLARNPSKAEEYLAGAPGGLRDHPRAVA
jgi:hypothetical protein